MEEEPLNVDEMEEEEQSSSPSTWLERLSRASFYVQCPKHKSKKHNLFCVHCTGKDSVFCELCRSQNDHKDHTIIRVYKASEHPAVRAHAIKSFKNIDVSPIQLYKINSSWIYFINKRPQKGNANSTHSHLQPKCQTCNRDLMPIHQSSGVFRFCSLACKFASDQDGSVRNEEAITSRTRHEPAIGVLNKNKHKRIAPPVHVRKHRRKGIPIRSPFF